MKKKILGATFVVAMATIAGYNTYVNQTKVEMSDMALANVEALANPEWEFPEDPFKGEGGDYEYRDELNYIRRTEYQLNDSLVMVYKTPVTEVICNGFGEVKCHIGFYSGESRYMGVESI